MRVGMILFFLLLFLVGGVLSAVYLQSETLSDDPAAVATGLRAPTFPETSGLAGTIWGSIKFSWEYMGFMFDAAEFQWGFLGGMFTFLRVALVIMFGSLFVYVAFSLFTRWRA